MEETMKINNNISVAFRERGYVVFLINDWKHIEFRPKQHHISPYRPRTIRSFTDEELSGEWEMNISYGKWNGSFRDFDEMLEYVGKYQ